MSRKGKKPGKKESGFFREFPIRPLRGEFLIAEAAIRETERLLPTYRGLDGDHEGIIYLLGRDLDELTVLTTALAPEAQTTTGSVHCTKEQMAMAVDAARQAGLGLLAQVHSHPQAWIEHSLGDDRMIFMPFEGMLSIVAPWYGRVGMRPLQNLGVHQYQDGRWVGIEPSTIRRGIRIVPASLDLR
jgi:proteasome lid subunit RPN8/RPN11